MLVIVFLKKKLSNLKATGQRLAIKSEPELCQNLKQGVERLFGSSLTETLAERVM